MMTMERFILLINLTAGAMSRKPYIIQSQKGLQGVSVMILHNIVFWIDKKTYRNLFFFSPLILIILKSSSVIAEEMHCPATLEVQQVVTTRPSSWHETGIIQRRHILENISFGVFNPAAGQNRNLPSQADEEIKEKNNVIAIWSLKDNHYRYAIYCIYNRTDKMLAQSLPETFTQCQVKYSVSKGKYYFKNVFCH